MRGQKPKTVEIEHKYTQDQIREMRMNELEEQINELKEENLELRNMMILLRKDLLPKQKSTTKNTKS